MESSVCYNFEFGFSSTKSDVVIHLSQWQYWWWFWFSLFWTLYFFITIKLINKRIIQFNPILNTSLRSHAKWGDFLISIIPLSWCGNILINSNFILRMIEFQNESSLFTIRVQGKQWYWVYKYNIETTMSTLCIPKSVGRGHWMIHKPGHVYVTNSYQEAVSICTKLEFYERYKEDVNRFKKKPLKFFFDLDIPYIKNLIQTNHLNNSITSNNSNLYFKIYDILRTNIFKKNTNKLNISIKQILPSLKNYIYIIKLKIQSNLIQKKNNNFYTLFKLKKEIKFTTNLIKTYLNYNIIKLQNNNKNLIYKNINSYKFINFLKKKKEIKLNKLLLTFRLLNLNKKDKNIIFLNEIFNNIIKKRYFNFYTILKELTVNYNLSDINHLYINKFLKDFENISIPNSNFFNLKLLTKEYRLKLTKIKTNIYYYNNIKNFNYIYYSKNKELKYLDFNKISLNLIKNITPISYKINKENLKNRYNEYIQKLQYISGLEKLNKSIQANIVEVKIDIMSNICNCKVKNLPNNKSSLYFFISKYGSNMLRIFSPSNTNKKKYLHFDNLNDMFRDWKIKKILDKDILNLIILNIFFKNNTIQKNNVKNYLKEFIKDTIVIYFKYKIQKVYNNNLKKKRFLIDIIKQSNGSYEKFLHLKYGYKISTNLIYSKKKYFWINLKDTYLNYFFIKLFSKLKNTNTNIPNNKFSSILIFIKKNLSKNKIYQAKHKFTKLTFFNNNLPIVIQNKKINSLFCKVLLQSDKKDMLYNAFALIKRYIKCTYCVLLQLNKDLNVLKKTAKTINNANKVINTLNKAIVKKFFKIFLPYKQNLQKINIFTSLQLVKNYKLYNNNLYVLNLLYTWNLKGKKQSIYFNVKYISQLFTFIKYYNRYKKKIFYYIKVIAAAGKGEEFIKQSYNLNYKVLMNNPIKTFKFKLLKKIGFNHNRQLTLLNSWINSITKVNQLVIWNKNINNLDFFFKKIYPVHKSGYTLCNYSFINFFKNLKYSNKVIANNKNFLSQLFSNSLFFKKKNLSIYNYKTKFLIFNLKNFILKKNNKQINIKYENYLNISDGKQQKIIPKIEYKFLNNFFIKKNIKKSINMFIFKKNNILSYNQKLKIIKLKVLTIVNILNKERDNIKKIKFIKYVQFLLELNTVAAIKKYIKNNKFYNKNLWVTTMFNGKTNKLYNHMPKKYTNIEKNTILKLMDILISFDKKDIKNSNNIKRNYEVSFILNKFYIRCKLQEILTKNIILKLKIFNLINDKKNKDLKKFFFKNYTSVIFLSKYFDLSLNLKLINLLKTVNSKSIKNLLQINKILNLFDNLIILKPKEFIVNLVEMYGLTVKKVVNPSVNILSKINSILYNKINIKSFIKLNYEFIYKKKYIHLNQPKIINILYLKNHLKLLKIFNLKKSKIYPITYPDLNIFTKKKTHKIYTDIEQVKKHITNKQTNLLTYNLFKVYLLKELNKNKLTTNNIIKSINIKLLLKKNFFFFNNNFKKLDKLNNYQKILIKSKKTLTLNEILNLFIINYNLKTKLFILNNIFIKNEISLLSDIFRQKFNGKFINNYISTIYKLKVNKTSSHPDYSILDENDDFSCNMREIELSKPSRLISGILNKHNLELLKHKNCKKLILFKYKFQDSNSSLTDKVATQEIIRGFRQKRKRRLGYEHFLFKPKLIFDSITFEPIGFKSKQPPIKEIKHYSYINDINLDNSEYFTEIEKINPKLIASKKPTLTKLKPDEIQKPVNRESYDLYSSVRLNKKHSEIIPVTLAKRLLRTRRTLVLPVHVNLTLITNSYDVVHSWFIPGLGLKMDCVPGRSTHHSLYIDSVGFYYGQCAEICGRYHHHMPIRVCALPFEHFMLWWKTRGIKRMHRWENSQILKNNGKNLTALRKKKNIINQLI